MLKVNEKLPKNIRIKVNIQENMKTYTNKETENVVAVQETATTYLIAKNMSKTKQELDNEINEQIEKNIEAAEPYFRCVLNFGDLLDFNDDHVLLRLSSLNSHLQFETDRNNNLIVRMPTKFNTSRGNNALGAKLYNWNEEHQLGEVTDSNGGFHLPVTNSVKAPDVAFILNARLENIDIKKGFPNVAPDFVIELRSDSDRLQEVIEKMLEYIENGVRLGWLIDPQTENVHIYRLNGNHTIQTFDEKLSGEEVLPKFELDLRNIFKKK